MKKKENILKKKRRNRCSNETEQQLHPPTLFGSMTPDRAAFSLSVVAAAQRKKKNQLTQQLNLDLLASICFDWFLLSLSLSPNLSDIDYSFNSLGRSLVFEIDKRYTTYTIQQLSDISDLWNDRLKSDRLAKQLQKNRNRPVIDSMIVICLLLSETSLFITCLPCCPQKINPPDHPAQSRIPPDQFIYQNRIISDHLKQQQRNPPQKKKNRSNTLVLPNSTLFTFCSLSSEKKIKKQQTHDISFSSMSAVPAATARSPNLFHTFFFCNLKNSFNLMVKQTINTLAVASNPPYLA